jgi:MFS family permease
MRLLMVLLAGQAMAVMDGSILTVAAPSLRVEMHASGAQLQLVVAAYTLGFAALVVTGARVGDVLGRTRAFLLGLVSFTLASLAAGLAPTPSFLIVVRALQGAAAALMTPQVLSIIQLQFEGAARARAIGAYSMVLAVGVAAGQVVGGLLVSAHLLADAWRPALLVNVPVGVLLLLCSKGIRVRLEGRRAQRLDVPGAATLAVALVALVLPLTVGRDAGWPLWVWPTLAVSAATLAVFVVHERRLSARGGFALFALELFRLPGIAAGVGAVALVMSAYAGLLLSLTVYLQGALRFTPLHAGLTFAIYASGFATASLSWTRARASVAERLPFVGPPIMACAMIGVGLIAAHRWRLAAAAPLLFTAGVGHACAFSPLAHRLAGVVRPEQAGDLSGLIMTASLIGQVLGVAAFTGIYLDAAPHGPGRALALTNGTIGIALLVISAIANRPAPAPRSERGRAHSADSC